MRAQSRGGRSEEVTVSITLGKLAVFFAVTLGKLAAFFSIT